MENKALQKSVSSLIKEISTREIITAKDYLFAAEWLKKNKTTQKVIKDAFKDDLAAAKKAVEDVKVKMDAFLDPLSKTEALVKKQMIAYDAALEEEKRKKALKLEAAEEKGLTDRTIQKYERDLEAAPEAAPQASGISYRELWSFEIEDLNSIPREYLVPNTDKLGKLARAMKDEACVPGVRFFSTKTIAARG